MVVRRIFRLFISSTFSDFIEEREALQQNVFPRLEKYCAKFGARFQPIDLRWGITEETQKNHDTMRICLEEVRRCQELSPRPNFAVLLGDRYGWEPIPSRIPLPNWKILLKAASSSDRKIIIKAYSSEPDRNAVPPTVWLKPNNGDWAARMAEEKETLQSLRRAVLNTNFSWDDRIPYFASATHQEIVLGALAEVDARNHVHVYVRHIDKLPLNETAKSFIDWDVKESSIVSGARERLSTLEKQLREMLDQNVHDYQTTWQDGNIGLSYIEQFCEDFYNHQVSLIDREIANSPKHTVAEARNYAHLNYAKDRSRNFTGRKRLVVKIDNYLKKKIAAKKTVAPLILLGDGGSGKSALLAHAAMQALETGKTHNACILVRHIGGVPGIETLRTLLSSLIEDICSAYGESGPRGAKNTLELKQMLERSLSYAAEDKPLWLFLDGLDHLDADDNAWSLEWISQNLPANVRVVMSVRPSPVADAAVRKFARSIVAIPAMSLAEGSAMLSAWLEDRKEATFNAGAEPSVGRKLTTQQRQNVLASFAKSGSALWLKLAFEEVSKWPSWRKAEPLPTTIHGLIDYFIEYRLLKDEGHPRIFVERALAFITLARFGLSEDELARALGTDENVREEFANNEKTSQKWEHVSLLPPSIWLRLYHDLKPYLGNIFVDGALLMRWFHREFSEVLQKKLLTSRFSKIATHAHLAAVFAKMAPGLETLFQDTDASSSQICTSLRRVMEQPWQLAKAKKHDELNNLISGFSFCMAKCAANRSRDLIQDFRLLKMLDVDGTTIANHWRMFFQTRAHLLDLGDEIWPAHRILFQLALEEASESAITLEAVSWKQSGYVNWSHAVSTSIPQSLPPTTVNWISSGHELVRDGWNFSLETPGEGVCYHSELLWGWDKSHLCVWDPSDGCIVRVHHIGDIRGVVPCNAQALVIDSTLLNCSLYDPITGQRKWTFKAKQCLKRIQVLNDTHLLIADVTASFVLEIKSGSTSRRFAHDLLQIPKSRRKDYLSIQVLDSRWLVTCYTDRSWGQTSRNSSMFFIAVYDIQTQTLIFAGNLEKKEGFTLSKLSEADSYIFVKDWQKSQLNVAGKKLYVWNGRLHKIDLSEKKSCVPQDITPQLTAGYKDQNEDQKEIEVFAANSDYMVFISAGGLSALRMSTGQVVSFPLSIPQTNSLSRASEFTRQWLSENKLVLLGHSHSAAKQKGHNFLWDIDQNKRQELLTPSLERMVILSANNDTLILSRDTRWDTDEGDYAQAEPIVSFNLNTSQSLVIYSSNRVVEHTRSFPHAWISDNQLVVMDGTDLVCLMTNQGIMWDSYVEKSLGSMVTITEDWQNEHRFAATGTERVQHFDFTKTEPEVSYFPHQLILGTVGELSGNTLTLWEDCNGLTESGGFGQFANWLQNSEGCWQIDDASLMEFLIAECPDFDGFDSYAVTQVCEHLLLCQGDSIHIFAPDESSGCGLVGSFQQDFVRYPFWVRGEAIYFQSEDDPNEFFEIKIENGNFGAAIPVKKECVFKPDEVPFQNIRPYRDLNFGPMKQTQLFKLGTPVNGWTAQDAVLNDQPREYVEFVGPQGQHVRWFGARDCRLLPHRVSFNELGGRQLFNQNAMTEVTYSIAMDGKVYFIALADGTVHSIQLIERSI